MFSVLDCYDNGKVIDPRNGIHYRRSMIKRRKCNFIKQLNNKEKQKFEDDIRHKKIRINDLAAV